MKKYSVNISKRVSLVLIAIVFAILAVISVGTISTPNKTVVALKEGVSLSKAFKTSYYKGEKIDIGGGVESTTVPNFTSGQLYVCYLKDGQLAEKTVDLQTAYENSQKTNKDNYDYVEVTNFNTEQNFNSNETKKVFKMTLKVYIADATEKWSELSVDYVVYSSVTDYEAAISAVNTLNTINSVLSNILTPIAVVVCSVGIVFAIFLGFKMARANNAEEREEAKKRIVYTIVAIAIGILLIIMFQLFARSSVGWFGLSDSADFFKL